MRHNPGNTRNAPPGNLHAALGKRLQALHVDFSSLLQEVLCETLGECAVAVTVLEHTDEQPTGHCADNSTSFTLAQVPAGSIYCSGQLARLMVDRLLGGQESVPEPRPLSVLEQQLWLGVLPPILQAYVQAWEQHCGVTPSLTLCETEVDNTGPFHLASYRVTSQYGSGEIAFILRTSVWRDLLVRGGVAHFSDTGTIKSPHTGLLQTIGNCQLTGRAVLGSTTISVHDLLYLQSGDIICLERRADTPVEIQVGAKVKAYGKPRVDNGRLLITVERTVAGGDDNGPQ